MNAMLPGVMLQGPSSRLEIGSENVPQRMASRALSSLGRTAAFSLLWLGFLVCAVYLYATLIHDVGAAYLAFFSKYQFPVFVLLYAAFDWVFRDRTIFCERPWRLFAAGFAGLFVLYVPSLYLVAFLLRWL